MRGSRTSSAEPTGGSALRVLAEHGDIVSAVAPQGRCLEAALDRLERALKEGREHVGKECEVVDPRVPCRALDLRERPGTDPLLVSLVDRLDARNRLLCI